MDLHHLYVHIIPIKDLNRIINNLCTYSLSPSVYICYISNHWCHKGHVRLGLYKAEIDYKRAWQDCTDFAAIFITSATACTEVGSAEQMTIQTAATGDEAVNGCVWVWGISGWPSWFGPFERKNMMIYQWILWTLYSYKLQIFFFRQRKSDPAFETWRRQLLFPLLDFVEPMGMWSYLHPKKRLDLPVETRGWVAEDGWSRWSLLIWIHFWGKYM